MSPESRRERKKREMHRKIVRVAIAHFTRDGFEATSLRAIADEVDVSIPTLHNYFGGKDGLLVATLERLVAVIEEGARSIVAGGLRDPDEVLELALTLGARGPPLPRDVMAHVIRVAATEPEVPRILERLGKAFEEVVRYAQANAGGRTDLEAALLARSMVDLILGAMVDWAHSPDVASEVHTEVVLRAAIELVVPGGLSPARSEAERALEALPLAEPGAAEPSTRSELPDRIRSEARALFAEHGVRETSVDAIAAAAGVSPLTVFYHFGSKDGLLAALALEVAAAVEEAATEAIATEEGDLRAGVAAIPRRFAQRPRTGPKLTAELLRVMLTHPDGMAAAGRIHGAMARLVAEGQSRGLARSDHGPRVLARLVLHLCYGGVLRWVQAPRRSSASAALDTMRAVQGFLQ